MSYSNLQSFLRCTTPTVPSQSLPKASVRNLIEKWQLSISGDAVEYFTLDDLWGCYDEWSAYGAGTPICLENGKTVVQYYTPFLSGIQLYVGKSFSLRRTREDSDFEVETDSASSDSEDGKLSTTNSDNSSRTWDLLEDSGAEQDGDNYKMKERFGELYLQHFDIAAPHLRLPLRDQINMLAEEYPGLKSLRSIDLSPASWMAVAWYPIYHIPAQRNPKELYSAFLTYHTLSSSFQDNISMETVEHINCTDVKSEEVKMITKEENGGTNISLSPFGLASYRMQSHVWIDPKSEDYERLTSLWRAAASWLMQLDVYHSDFTFFSSRSI
ncbi:hypothetical protein Taro_013628 [Colocasia esculenta]|uniref:Uncharacterized protein n=1 Tax=Colocasia esculenta TaxID=4460 RepID=A0A843UMP5_COLES|nr:hypothetical protein [Colocasia esculenta]